MPRFSQRRKGAKVAKVFLRAERLRGRNLSRGMLRDNREYVSGASADANGHQSYGRTRHSCLRAPTAILWPGANLSTSSTPISSTPTTSPMDARFGRVGTARRIRRHQSDRPDASQRVGPGDRARPAVGERRLVSLRLSHPGSLRDLATPAANKAISCAARVAASLDLSAVLRGLGDLRQVAALGADGVIRSERSARGD